MCGMVVYVSFCGVVVEGFVLFFWFLVIYGRCVGRWVLYCFNSGVYLVYFFYWEIYF